MILELTPFQTREMRELCRDCALTLMATRTDPAGRRQEELAWALVETFDRAKQSNQMARERGWASRNGRLAIELRSDETRRLRKILDGRWRETPMPRAVGKARAQVREKIDALFNEGANHAKAS